MITQRGQSSVGVVQRERRRVEARSRMKQDAKLESGHGLPRSIIFHSNGKHGPSPIEPSPTSAKTGDMVMPNFNPCVSGIAAAAASWLALRSRVIFFGWGEAAGILSRRRSWPGIGLYPRRGRVEVGRCVDVLRCV